MDSQATAGIAESLVSDVIQIYTDRANAIKRATLAKQATKNSKALDANFELGRSIVLRLEATNTSPPTVPTRPRGPASAGNKTQQQPQPPTTSTIAQVVFDVAPENADGYAQSVSYGDRPRQTTHQTPAGYYNDQFGFAPGNFSLTAIVVTQDNIFDDMQKFKSLLRQAKQSTPFAPDPAPKLHYENAIDGRSLILNVAAMDLQQSARDPNQCVLTISGEIFQDYSNPKKWTQTVQQLRQSDADTGSTLLSYTDFNLEGVNVQDMQGALGTG